MSKVFSDRAKVNKWSPSGLVSTADGVSYVNSLPEGLESYLNTFKDDAELERRNKDYSRIREPNTGSR